MKTGSFITMKNRSLCLDRNWIYFFSLFFRVWRCNEISRKWFSCRLLSIGIARWKQFIGRSKVRALKIVIFFSFIFHSFTFNNVKCVCLVSLFSCGWGHSNRSPLYINEWISNRKWKKTLYIYIYVYVCRCRAKD